MCHERDFETEDAMRILIVSDTHGNERNLERALVRTYPVDIVCHLGDLEGGESYIEEICPCPVHMVSGNNDFFSPAPSEKIIEVEGFRIFMTHGHRYGGGYNLSRLREAAHNHKCDMVFFGHTHQPMVDEDDALTVVNPGSLTYPRQAGHHPSYIVMEIAEDGTVEFSVNYLD